MWMMATGVVMGGTTSVWQQCDAYCMPQLMADLMISIMAMGFYQG
jgi:hypothetical protein